ncbi:MAG TPA: hypothetical protein VKU62_03500, partial [Thermoanaerobaculia bacterium]|nr:hypothetical protein [Thermoanaerobaculia bacterium]
MRGPASNPALIPITHIPPIGSEATADFSEANTKAPTQTQMRNVDFRVADDIALNIHELRGEMQAKEAGKPVNFDNKMEFVLRVDRARIGLKSPSLDALMNR